MNITVFPKKLSGQVTVPPSKSVAHRMVIAAALSNGVSEITNLYPSVDILATMDCMRALGAKIDFDGDKAVIEGIKDIPESAVLDCCESGSTLRFLIPGLRRRRICRRRGDGFGADGRRPGDRSRHAAARDPSALRRRRRPHPGRRGAVPRRGQLLGHRLVEAAHRRQMGSLRPFSDERNAGSFLRRAGAAAHPRRASFGHRRMRKRNAFRRNILPLTNDGFGKNFLYLRELQRNTQ